MTRPGRLVWRGDPQRKVRFELRIGRFLTSFVHKGVHVLDTHSQALGEWVNGKIAQQMVDIFTVGLPDLTLPRIYGGDMNQSAGMRDDCIVFLRLSMLVSSWRLVTYH